MNDLVTKSNNPMCIAHGNPSILFQNPVHRLTDDLQVPLNAPFQQEIVPVPGEPSFTTIEK